MSNKAPAAPRGEQVLSRQHSILPAGGREITPLKIEHFDAMEEPVYGELTIRNKEVRLNFDDASFLFFFFFTGLGFLLTVEDLGD